MQANPELAVTIKEVREQLGLSQYAVSKLMGKKTMGHYWKIEKGMVTPTVERALRIARAFNCKVEDIYKLID